MAKNEAKKDKRGHHEGSFQERKDGRWMGRIMINYEEHCVYGKTEPECKRKIREILRQSQNGTLSKRNTKTFAEVAEEYLNAVKANPGKEITTWENYKMTIDSYIIPKIGALEVKKITVDTIQDVLDDRTPVGRRLKKEDKLSPRTMQLIRNMCIWVLDYAIKKKYVEINVAKDTTPIRKKKIEMKYIPPHKFPEFMKEIESEFWYTAIILDLCTGMRRGELMGLKWQRVTVLKDIDEEGNEVLKGKIKVTESLRQTWTEGVQLANVKTDAALRDIPLPQIASRALLKHQEKQNQAIKNMGKLYNDQGYVFARPDGDHYSPAAFAPTLTRVLTKIGVGHIRIHDLRHSFATYLLSKGEDINTVQQMLGHESPATTWGIYAHVVPGQKEKAASKFDTNL
jgi:integrase